MKRDRTAVRAAAAMLLTMASAAHAADDKRDTRQAPALLADAVRKGDVDADTAAEITRWILSARQDAVARGLIEVMRSADLPVEGRDAELWKPAVNALAALFESALDDGAARRHRDPRHWPELDAVVRTATPAIAAALKEADPAALQAMKGVVASIPDPGVREAATEALRRIEVK